MKRINPKTNAVFKRGDTREDGYMFDKYQTSKLRKNGTFQESWLSPKAFEKENISKRNIAKIHKENNPELYKTRNFNWRKNNLEIAKKLISDWAKNNPGKRSAYEAKRRAAKLQRTPKWLTADELERIQALYSIAAMFTKETGIEHHVDHITPLQGKLVSGLHVYKNLRILPAIENLKKSNKHDI